MTYRITIDKTGGSGGTDEFFCNDGEFYADQECTVPFTAVTLPSKVGYAANGCWSATSGGTKYVNAQGGFKAEFRSLSISSDLTIHVQWSALFYKVTVDKQGGSGGTDEFYYRKSGGGLFSDLAFTTPITQIVKPSLECFSFAKCYSEPSGAGTQYTGGSGALLPALTDQSLTTDITIYVNWSRLSYKITVDKQGGSGGTDAFYSSVNGGFYAEDTCETAITGITPPAKALNIFKSLRSSLPNGTKYTNGAGTFESVFTQMEIDADMTVYVLWQTTYVTILIDKQGGAGGTSALYSPRGAGGIYAEPACETPVTSVDTCSRTGYTYTGAWTEAGGAGTKYISDSGNFINGFASLVLSDDLRIYVHWTALVYTLAFDYAGGSGTVQSKSVTFGEPIGSLPTSGNVPSGVFSGWMLNGDRITAQTVWNIAANAIAVAHYRSYFGNLTDYFDLDGNRLMLVGSESGTGRQVTNLWNGAYEQGPGLLNPVCTYRVKAKGDITIQLGKAFKSGYMITELEYKTGADQEPTLTVRGVANEGEDAINLYNVTFAADPDHIAQDPFGAVSGGGELVEMTSSATCDPVVPYEDNRPCASDVVHGRLVVSGRTAAYFGESAPAIVNSFIDRGVPSSESDVDFTSYAFAAERVI